MRKGISQTLWIVVVVVVILVVALVILTVFGGGIGNFLNIFNPWVNATAGSGACSSACASLCAANPNREGQPPGWAETSNDLNCDRFSIVCDCSASGSLPFLGSGNQPGTSGAGTSNQPQSSGGITTSRCQAPNSCKQLSDCPVGKGLGTLDCPDNKVCCAP